MAIVERLITMLAQWGKTAQTAIPAPPVPGIAYRNAGLTEEDMESGQAYDKVYDSARYNQLDFLVTGLLQSIEQYGVLPWSALTGYKEGGLCLGLDGELYQAVRDSGPSAGGFRPTDDTAYWKKAVDLTFDPSRYGVFTTRQTLTVSGPWTAPINGWYRITCIGAGGAGGYGGYGPTPEKGGGAGGITKFGGLLNAEGGSGGGSGTGAPSGGYSAACGGGGGGGAGSVRIRYAQLTKGQTMNCTIGGGGTPGTSTKANGAGDGPNGGGGSIYPYRGGGGAPGASNGSGCDATSSAAQNGGAGGVNSSGYGGGGGGGAGYNSEYASPGTCMDGAYNDNISRKGGYGGNGAIIIEYQGEI